jgi:diguanylate cyclase (GGDEF)-like protein/PAS domain S-box-containing protein
MADSGRPEPIKLTPIAADELRRQAEEILGELAADPTAAHQDAAALLHELRVHQIELEMQNEELRDAQLELDEQREKYFELFDRAPVGYLTVSGQGIVGDANHTASLLLGTERALLVGKPLSAFVFPADRSRFYECFLTLEQTGEARTWELRLRRFGDNVNDDNERAPGLDADYFWARLEARPRGVEGETSSVWVTFTDIELRKQEDEALRESRDRQSQILEHGGIGVACWDLDGRLLTVNRRAIQNLGGGVAEDYVGKTYTELFGDEIGGFYTARVQEVASSAEPLEFLDRAEMPGGARWFSSVHTRFLDAEGKVAGVHVYAHDVTEIKQAEEALVESERWLCESQRIAQIGHYVYDIEADRWDGSVALYEVLGVGEESYKRDFNGWLNVGHPTERERLDHYFTEEVLGGQAPFNIEYRIVRPCDGVERWVHGLGTVDFAEDGHPVAMFGVIQDITERKLAELEVEHRRALLARAEAIGHLGSWRVGVQGGVREWSEEAERVLGFAPTPEEQDGFKAFSDAVHPDDRSTFETWRHDVGLGEAPCGAEFRIVRPDGEVRCVSVYGAPESGGVDGTITIAGILHDVTERKGAEEERFSHLEQAANIDRLTGLHNLRGFDRVVEQSMAQAMRAEQGIGLIFCDLDGLKAINDEFGHAQGDRALQDVASIIKFTLRSADAIARIGGDEFIVLAIGGDSTTVHRLNERLQEGFDFFNATTARPYRILVSSGTAWCAPGETCVFDELKASADREMYAEKLRRRRAL